ncbi:MAG: hypothetical protein K6A23_07445 [Butyrivibrio sp.]|nr:hypothetical protein [Butyrivibrio sp.]
MTDNQELKMTYTALLPGPGGKKIVRVQFERGGRDGVEIAEGILPESKIVKQKGYSREEIEKLELFLSQNSEDIMKKAKTISNPLRWL